jgi:hypothetical protein
LTFRYNPQSLEKQVRKWPVFFSENNLHLDIEKRLGQLSGANPTGWYDPYSVELPFEKDLIYEYGMDACRFAVINSGYKKQAESFLEPSFKWIAKFHEISCHRNKTDSFNPIPWLEAIIQMQDHIITRKADRLALALVMKAFKESPLSCQLTESDELLIASCLFPFIPIYAANYFPKILEINSIKKIIESFTEYSCVKIALEKGGWHWHVFTRKSFENAPIDELSKIRWIKKAIIGKNINLKNEAGGIRICFS